MEVIPVGVTELARQQAGEFQENAMWSSVEGAAVADFWSPVGFSGGANLWRALWSSARGQACADLEDEEPTRSVYDALAVRYPARTGPSVSLTVRHIQPHI